MNNKPTVLDKDRTENVCKRGQGRICCSFLIIGEGGFCCSKGSDFAAIIEERRSLETMRAMGNNCSGPPDYTPTAEEPVTV